MVPGTVPPSTRFGPQTVTFMTAKCEVIACYTCYVSSAICSNMAASGKNLQ
jgi:hypothetical protein